MSRIIRLPSALQAGVETFAAAFLAPRGAEAVDFARPAGEYALVPPDSVSWRIFKNPVALFVGGVTAVLLELAEPSVRAGVWEHSTFRSDPAGRMRRTGSAAMVTVYGARSVAERVIARVGRMHARVAGTTTAGVAYRADDPALLIWVQATAAFGFAQAFSRYVEPLSAATFDAYYREGEAASRLYGAVGGPRSGRQMEALLAGTHERLEASEILHRFLGIMREAPILPGPLRWMQRLFVRAAIDLVPDPLRIRLDLGERLGLRSKDLWLVRAAGRMADRIVLPSGPAAQSCLRLGLPPGWLYA